MDSEHTDQAFEAALTRGLRRDTADGAHCPEPELIAAYADGTLPDDERTSWVGHFAGCARCQAHLAALARTTPVEAVPAGPVASHLRWLFDWHWIAAASSVAIIIVAVWVANPDQLPGPDAPRVGDAGARGLASEAPAAQPLRRALAEPERQEAPASIAGAQPQLEAAGGAARETRRQFALAEPAEIAAEVDALSFIDSPARAAVWRVAASGAIEHSRDAGVTWIVQVADPGADLTAGSAPSDVVCWLVGREGAVFRTSDGTSWARLPSPAPDDLVRIEAEDAQAATVTTAGGLSFRTVDGGQTWATP